MDLHRLAQLNNAIDSYFTLDELKYINIMIHSYQKLIDKDPAYETDDYISELFLLLVELKRKGVPDEVRSRARYYLQYLKTLMLARARRTKIRKKIEEVLLQLHSSSSSGNRHIDNLNSFVKFLLNEGEDELFYILLMTISSVLNDKESKLDKLNISRISADLPMHYLEYRRHIEKIRRLYEQT